MRTKRAITVVGCHAGGEVGNVIVGGVLPPAGDTVFERMEALRADDSLRRLLLREPRGSVATHANLIVPSALPDCDAGLHHHGADRVSRTASPDRRGWRPRRRLHVGYAPDEHRTRGDL